MVGFIAGTCVFLVIGGTCLLLPRQVQRLALWLYDRWSPRVVRAFLLRQVTGDSYISYLRFIGAFSVAVGLFCVWILAIGKPPH